MEIKMVKLSEIVPYENNPRKNVDAVEPVKESIKRYGFKVPMILDAENVIVAGHTRYEAAQALGMTEVPVIYADDLTEEQVKEFRLVDNKTAEFAEWDFEKLEEELANIDFGDFDFGFDISADLEENTQVQEDDYEPELPKEPKSKVGDLYQLGNHRLICGDSTDAAVIDRLMDGKVAKLMLTDPPYGISVVVTRTVETGKVGGWNPSLQTEARSEGTLRYTSGRGKVGGGSMSTPKENRIQPDAVIPAKEYRPVIGDETTETAKKNYEVSKKFSENQIIFGGNYFTDFLPPSRCWVVWDKENTGNFADAELAWTSFDKGVKLYHFMWNGLAREGSREVEGITRVHPTQKPVGMLGNILQDFSEEQDAILDCFGGSGSTLIACEQLNRRCYMCELDPHYVDVIIDRWEKLTGEKAVLLNG